MSIFYTLAIHLYTLAIHVAAFFSSKARQWVEGRKHWRSQLAARFPSSAPVIWMHCASLGEFEQGRPLLEEMRTAYPNHQIVLTFFSPSGYNIRKDYAHANYVCYLPADTPQNAQFFIEQIQAQIAIFVKYEFWINHLNYLHKKKIPTFLIAALFRPSQPFFRWYGGLFRKALFNYTHIFVQNEASLQNLQSLGIGHCSIAGDPRIDRVLQIAQNASPLPIIKAFCGNDPLLIAGSTWPPDEALLSHFFAPPNSEEWKLIIAPHDIRESHLQQIERLFPQHCLRYSQASTEQATTARILIIDNIGMLSSLYRYGQLAYLGGGFGQGIHNILEPAAFALPILFGPRFQKFEEAVQLIERKGAFSVNNKKEFSQYFEQLKNVEERKRAGREIQHYLEEAKGATEKIMRAIAPYCSGR